MDCHSREGACEEIAEPPVVMAGLDPAIQLTYGNYCLFPCDGPIKSGHDSGVSCRNASAQKRYDSGDCMIDMPAPHFSAAEGAGMPFAAVRMASLMARALFLAEGNLGVTSPNPSVGAVIADAATGEIVASAVTAPDGRPHAEVQALRQAGEKARGGILFTTLEPCSHFGATPPCAHSIADAGVATVVYGSLDPDMRVAGRVSPGWRATALKSCAAISQEPRIGSISGMRSASPSGGRSCRSSWRWMLTGAYPWARANPFGLQARRPARKPISCARKPMRSSLAEGPSKPTTRN